MAVGPSRTAAAIRFLRRRPVIARSWLYAMVLVAILVQIVVWGTPRPPGNGGSLLPQLRHAFGVEYAVLLLGAELFFCAAYALRRAAQWVLIGCATVDLSFWIAHLAGSHFPTGDAASLTSGVGAVLLAAGVVTGKFEPAAPSGHRLPEEVQPRRARPGIVQFDGSGGAEQQQNRVD